ATSESSSEDTQQTTSESETATEPEPSEPEVDPLPPVEVPPSAAERCLDGVLDAAQTSCYRAVTIPATWDNARIDCNNWGGRLVQVDSGAEDLLVGELVTVNQWLGASDTVIDNVYVWTDGSPILFGNWGLSQPDRFPGADCIEKRETPGRQWFDQPCYNVRAYVCEKGL
ncbi:MAG TPA: C-type lectin domain-containing protein, partial [Polyangiaceae bacterium]|nr:C-type lectin domain-containing protein [Polyangiaceae bacterium]